MFNKIATIFFQLQIIRVQVQNRHLLVKLIVTRRRTEKAIFAAMILENECEQFYSCNEKHGY